MGPNQGRAMTTLHFQKFGQGTQKLIILHGLFGSGDNWRSLTQKYLAEQFEVYLVDQRNHGKSFHHPDHSYHDLATDIVELMDRSALPKASVIGHSMGGKTAMTLTALAPERIEKLLVADIAPKSYRHSHGEIIEAMKALPVGSATSRKELESFMMARLPDPMLRGFLLKSVERTSDGTYRWKINIPAIEANYEELIGWNKSLQPITTPTLFVAGGASKYIVQADHTEIVEQFPNSTLREIPGAGHWLHYQAPKEFVAEILEFMSS